jgi:uncharacterized protein (TIGR02466 family)
MTSHEIYPLFPSTVLDIEVEEDFTEFKEQVKNLEFKPITSELAYNQQISLNRYIFKKFTKEKKIFLDYFNTHYKDNILKQYHSTFEITTSWATKSLRGSFGQYHNHCNSMYSGVFYFDNMNTPLQFGYGPNAQRFMLEDPVEWNIHNSRIWPIYPRKNHLIIFPSYLQHRICTNYKDPERISIAFNLFPVGEFGVGDSMLKVQIQN